MEAHNRSITDWFTRIRTRQLTLPRFQRMEAWDHKAVADLLTTILRDLPAGAALILSVGDHEQFLSRPMQGAPEDGERVTEQLLDGQQRLTALWRSLHNDYLRRTYLVGFEDDPNREGAVRSIVYGQSRWQRNGQTYPIWVEYARGCWERGLIPVTLLHPDVEPKEMRQWVRSAMPNADEDGRDELFDTINKMQQKVKYFNLPYLALPVDTPREVALEVFIKMNTSSVRLTMYDIVVALVEEAAGESLHDLVDKVRREAPRASAYTDISNLVLDVAALRQNRTPNNAGYKGLDFETMIAEWDTLIAGIQGMVALLEEERIFDDQRLPAYPPLPVIAALWSLLPTQPDALGNARHLLRKYLWRSFLTSRYDRATAGGALQDYRGLKKMLDGEDGETGIPIFDESNYPPPSVQEIVSADWPKRRSILGRGLLALQIRCGALDIADGAPATAANIQEREYHHLFPDSLLKECDVEQRERFRAVNCALITWRTNRTLSNKTPLVYLTERADNNALGEEDLRHRLRTHLIPYDALALTEHDALDGVEECVWLVQGYRDFMRARAKLLQRAAMLACEGKPLALQAIYQE